MNRGWKLGLIRAVPPDFPAVLWSPGFLDSFKAFLFLCEVSIQMADFEKRDEMAEEKYLEDVTEKKPASEGQLSDNAALTRKILLKLDFRYKPQALSSRTMLIPLVQDLACPRPALPLLIPRSNKCRKCEDIRTRDLLENDRPSIRHWISCFLCYIHRQVCLLIHSPDSPQAKLS